MYATKTHSIAEISQLSHLSRSTVYRYLAWQEKK
ncbi:helix-turn-helix domain-containing protein [Larkinella soli]|nr:helix-turn-helix domain-containing protein [Larkinella soli]